MAVGTDNIADYMLPFSDGDMWEELKLLTTGCRYTDLEAAINIATTNGLRLRALCSCEINSSEQIEDLNMFMYT